MFSIYPAWCSLSSLDLLFEVWRLSLISEKSWPLSLKIFLLLCSFLSLWHSNYVYVIPLEIVPRFLDVLGFFFFFFILFFFFTLCIWVWEVYFVWPCLFKSTTWGPLPNKILSVQCTVVDQKSSVMQQISRLKLYALSSVTPHFSLLPASSNHRSFHSCLCGFD